MNEKERFESKINRHGPIPEHRPELGPCHVWTASLDHQTGYGWFSFKRKPLGAHRVAFYFAHGRWATECVCHHCDNRGCVNPKHLFEGTRAENLADMRAKGRHAHGPNPKRQGENHNLAKLTAKDVQEIRALYAAGGVTQTALARRWGISQTHASDLIRGKCWGHLR